MFAPHSQKSKSCGRTWWRRRGKDKLPLSSTRFQMFQWRLAPIALRIATSIWDLPITIPSGRALLSRNLGRLLQARAKKFSAHGGDSLPQKLTPQQLPLAYPETKLLIQACPAQGDPTVSDLFPLKISRNLFCLK